MHLHLAEDGEAIAIDPDGAIISIGATGLGALGESAASRRRLAYEPARPEMDHRSFERELAPPAVTAVTRRDLVVVDDVWKAFPGDDERGCSHFEMEVRLEGGPRVSHARDDLAAPNALAGFHAERPGLQMHVVRELPASQEEPAPEHQLARVQRPARTLRGAKATGLAQATD